MATTTLRPSSTIANTFTLAGLSDSAHATLGRSLTDPDTVSPSAGTLIAASGTVGEVTVSLPGIPRLSGITGAVVHVFLGLPDSPVAGTSDLRVFLYDTEDAVIDDEIVFSSGTSAAAQWVSSTTSVTTSNQLTKLTIAASAANGSYFQVMAAYVVVTYTAGSGLSNTEGFEVVFPSSGLKKIGVSDVDY